MKKKLFLVTTLALGLLSNSAAVSAQPLQDSAVTESIVVDDSFVELLQTDSKALYEKYSNIVDIQEVQLDDEQLSKYVEAYECSEDGMIEDVDCTATLNKITYRDGSVSPLTADRTSTIYVLMAESTSKTSENSATQYGVTLKGSIVWIDHFGMSNELVSISGERSGSYDGDAKYAITGGTTPIGSGTFDTSFENNDYAGSTAFQFILTIASNPVSGKRFHITVKTSVTD